VSRPWLLFDLDGTLFDYEAAESAAVRAALEQVGVEADTEVLATYRRANAAAWAALERGETTPAALRVDRWRAVLGAEADPSLLEQVATGYVAALATGTQLLDGAEAVVGQLAATHRLAFITNGLADVQRPRLRASALADAAEVVVISDEVGAAKPDAAIFDVAFERMGAPPRREVTMIGDSPSADVAGGLGYGLPTVWFAPSLPPEAPPVTPLGQRPTHVVRRLQELPPLLAPGW
jgi:2-haloacid dehalogenase